MKNEIPKILAFPTAEPLPENPFEVARASGYCSHDKITLDEHQRQVRCAMCDQVFDPFEFLRNEAVRLQHAWSAYRQAMHRYEEKKAGVEALTREEMRLKGRIRTLKSKADPAIDVRGNHL